MLQHSLMQQFNHLYMLAKYTIMFTLITLYVLFIAAFWYKLSLKYLVKYFYFITVGKKKKIFKS